MQQHDCTNQSDQYKKQMTEAWKYIQSQMVKRMTAGKVKGEQNATAREHTQPEQQPE
jgi:hypothetical protein